MGQYVILGNKLMFIYLKIRTSDQEDSDSENSQFRQIFILLFNLSDRVKNEQAMKT